MLTQFARCTAVENDESLIEEYLSWKQSYTRSAAAHYRIWVTRFQRTVNKIPEMLTHFDCIAFANSLTGRYSSKSIQFAMNVIRNYLRFFAEQGRLRFSLLLVRVPRAESESHYAVTESEYRSMLELLKQSRSRSRMRDISLLMLLHDTGLRVTELLSLDLDDIEEDQSAVVRSEKSYRKRRVFWSSDTDMFVQQHLAIRTNEHLDTDALFVSLYNKGARLTRRSVERLIIATARKAGLTADICPHSFRHSFVHRMAKLGAPDAIIAQLVGHSTPHTVAHYTKLSRPEFEEAARKQFANAA